jgi:hypothetical protein
LLLDRGGDLQEHFFKPGGLPVLSRIKGQDEQGQKEKDQGGKKKPETF